MKKIEKYIYIILIIILVGALAGTTAYILTKNDNKEHVNKPIENTPTIKEEDKNKSEEKISLSDEKIKTLLKYIPFLDASSINEDEYADAYDGNQNSIDNINKEILLYMALTNTKENNNIDYANPPRFDLEIRGDADIYYNENDINENLLKMFNINSINISLLYIPGGFLYYQSPYYGAFFTAGAESYYKINKNIKSQVLDDCIIIEEEALFLREADYDADSKNIVNKSQYKLYANTSDMKKNENVLNKTEIYYTINHDMQNINSNEYSGYNFTKYKHTFKKNETGYYWYKTEVV